MGRSHTSMEDTIRAPNAQLEAVLEASTHAAIIATDLNGTIPSSTQAPNRCWAIRPLS